MRFQQRFPKAPVLLLWTPILILSCILSQNAAAGNVTVVVATEKPAETGEAGGGGPPADTTESPPTPTYTVAHLATPPGASGTTRYITDPESKDYAPQQKANPGADVFAGNRYERPFTAEAMAYLADVDLTRVEMKIAAPWVYVTFFPSGTRAEGIGRTVYGAEFDTDKDGRGEYLVWGVSPPSGEWTVTGVEVWKDSNNDVGGAVPQANDAPNPSRNGYDERLFADGQGADPDLAWIRQVEGGTKIQLAFKYSVLGNASQFLWNGLADAGIRNPAWFDYNDHFTPAEAGSPNTYDGDRYPLKALWGVDNTCRDAYGFTPAGDEPGLCGYPGTIRGKVFYDENADGIFGSSIWDDPEPDQHLTLGLGACPSEGLQTATTDGNGDYAFTDIVQGTYCVTFVYTEWMNAVSSATPNPRTVLLPPFGEVVVNFGIYTDYT
jgi:hypothetical protein